MQPGPEPADAPAPETSNPVCACCGAEWPAFGYSRKNPKALPRKLQTIMRVCGRPECKARAESWKARADAALNQIAPRPTATRPAPDAQAALF